VILKKIVNVWFGFVCTNIFLSLTNAALKCNRTTKLRFIGGIDAFFDFYDLKKSIRILYEVIRNEARERMQKKLYVMRHVVT
jgi:hypothetical protein